MNATIQRPGRSDAPALIDRTVHVQRTETCDALDKSLIAELTPALIDQMTSEELCRVIRAADLPSLGGIDVDGRLTFYDRPTLVRMAHLARRICQTQGHRDPSQDGSALQLGTS